MGDEHVREALTDVAAERSVLSVAIDDQSAWALCCEVVDANDFSSPVRRNLWLALGELISSGATADETMLHASCPDAGTEISCVSSTNAQISNAVAYSERVRKLSELRSIRSVCRSLDSAIDGSADPDHLASLAMERMLASVTRSEQSRMTSSYGELMRAYVDDLGREKALRDSGKMVGAIFDFQPMDEFTYGMRWGDGDVMILAGPPGEGKTALSMFLARRFAMKQRSEAEPVGTLFLSLEMGRYATAMRWAQMVGQVSSSKLRGGMESSDILSLSQNVAHESDLPLWTNFASNAYADQLKAMIANAVRKHNIKLIILDHMRLMRMRGKYHDQNLLDEARANYIKEMCSSLKVAAIVLGHSTKAASGRDDKTPQMDDLKGSRQISAAVDSLAFIYRPYLVATPEERANKIYEEDEAYLVWTKNRFSSLKKPRFVFSGDKMQIAACDAFGRTRPEPRIVERVAPSQLAVDEW